MDFAGRAITVIYYCMVGYVSLMLVWNLLKEKRWDREVLYIIVLLPFLLRLFHLK